MKIGISRTTRERENQDIFSPPSNILSLSTSESKKSPKTPTFYLFIIFLWNEDKTARHIKNIANFQLKTYSAL